MYVLTKEDGVAWRDANNFPVIVSDLSQVEPVIRDTALEVSIVEARFIMEQAFRALLGWRYLPVWLQ